MAFGYNFVLPAIGAYVAYRYGKYRYNRSGKKRLRGPEHPTKKALKAAIHDFKTSKADYQKFGNLRGASAKMRAYYNRTIITPVPLPTKMPKKSVKRSKVSSMFRFKNYHDKYKYWKSS